MHTFIRHLLPVFAFFLLSAGTLFSQQPQTRVTLGIKPDYMYTFKGKGVRINGVLDGQAAKQAGLREGDVITAFDTHDIKDIFAYRDRLATYAPGDRVRLTVNRDGQVFTVPILFK